MTRACPVCNSESRSKLRAGYDSPDWVLYKCKCNMLYLDSPRATEEGLNKYYNTVYRSDDGPVADQRLDSMARFVLANCQSPVLDIGGNDGNLPGRLTGMQVQTSGAGEWPVGVFATVILSHTLEHVYNVQGLLNNIKSHLALDGLLVIEVPIWSGTEDYMAYDYHLQHCNKFTVGKLEDLFKSNGFAVVQSESIDHYIEYHCHRLLVRLINKARSREVKKNSA